MSSKVPFVIENVAGLVASVASRMAKKTILHKRNFFDVVNEQPNLGVGLKLTRRLWNKYQTLEAPCYWTVQKVILGGDARHGKAWGKLTWKGVESPKTQQIRSTLKKEWKIYDPNKIMKQKQQTIDNTTKYVFKNSNRNKAFITEPGYEEATQKP